MFEVTALYYYVYAHPVRRVSHTKTSLVGSSISIPITNGRLNLGTWQGISQSPPLHRDEKLTLGKGIYLTEFRHAPHSRKIVATILYVLFTTTLPQSLTALILRRS